jgi:hypothetical protein
MIPRYPAWNYFFVIFTNRVTITLLSCTFIKFRVFLHGKKIACPDVAMISGSIRCFGIIRWLWWLVIGDWWLVAGG